MPDELPAKADYQNRRTPKLDPDNDEVRKLRDEVVKEQNHTPKLVLLPLLPLITCIPVGYRHTISA